MSNQPKTITQVSLPLLIVAVIALSACGNSSSQTPVLPPLGSNSAGHDVSTCVRHCVSAEYPIPIPKSGALFITAGSDGNLWFPEGNDIGRITTSGVITSFPTPNKNSSPYGITSGPDGNLWFTESDALKVGRITTSGVVSEFDVSGFPRHCTYPATCGQYLDGIGRGPNGGVWFARTSWFCFKQNCSDTTSLNHISTSGRVLFGGTGYPNDEGGLALGPDGDVWFTDARSHVGKMTPAGVITEFATPTNDSTPEGIVKGPDGNLWFTEFSANRIGKITTSGVITEYPIPTASSFPIDITSLPHGALWFTELGASQIGKITTGGVITEYPIPTASSGPFGITAGPDGDLWFVEDYANKIARFIP